MACSNWITTFDGVFKLWSATFDGMFKLWSAIHSIFKLHCDFQWCVQTELRPWCMMVCSYCELQPLMACLNWLAIFDGVFKLWTVTFDSLFKLWYATFDGVYKLWFAIFDGMFKLWFATFNGMFKLDCDLWWHVQTELRPSMACSGCELRPLMACSNWITAFNGVFRLWIATLDGMFKLNCDLRWCVICLYSVEPLLTMSRSQQMTVAVL